jgi:hypothetical protein
MLGAVKSQIETSETHTDIDSIADKEMMIEITSFMVRVSKDNRNARPYLSPSSWKAGSA